MTPMPSIWPERSSLCGGQSAAGCACSATPALAEHVRARTRGGALRGPETHPVTPRTLGARVVGVLGPHRWGLGGGTQRTVRVDPLLWVPRPSGVLGWLS